MKTIAKNIAFVCLFAAAPAFAMKTSLLQPHSGLIFGAGTYFHAIAGQNAYDPVPEITPSGTTAAGTTSSLLLPIKAGGFWEFGGAELLFVEVYGRYMINTNKPWTVSGDISGTGTTSWTSWGGGLNAGLTFLANSWARMQLVMNGEYMFERAALKLTGSGPDQSLALTSTGLLAGAGIRFEFEFLDTGILSLSGLYQYGVAGTWSAPTAGTFMGISHSGALVSQVDGGSVVAQHGGILVEACLKLPFN